MRILRSIALSLLMITLWIPHAFADVSAEERQKAFAWYDSMGYPDVAHLSLVKIPGRGISNALAFAFGGTSPEDYAFLTRTDGRHFSVCLLTLDTVDLTVSPRTKDSPEIYYHPVELQTYVQQLLKWQADDKTQAAIQEHRSQADNKSQAAIQEHRGPVELFVLARACEGIGLSSQAAQLCNMAGSGLAIYGRDGVKLSSFQAKVADVIGNDTFYALYRKCGNPEIPRADLLAQIELYLKRFPSGMVHAKAVEIEKELQRMVVEDREHAARTASPTEKASQQYRIDALVFALRDQNGYQNMNPGYCDVFNDPRGEQSPASQLVKIGLPAVPALLEELTDTRLTRSVEGFMDRSGGILTIGEAAQQIMEKIAHRRFKVQADSDKERAVAFQKAARAWWADVQAKGEKQVLNEAVRRGDENSAEQADRLAELDSNLALAAVKEGILPADSDWNRQALVHALGDLHRPDTKALIQPLLQKCAQVKFEEERKQAFAWCGAQGYPDVCGIHVPTTEGITCRYCLWRPADGDLSRWRAE